jgi:hypothetical protein
MKNILQTTIAAALALTATGAWATESRINGMSGGNVALTGTGTSPADTVVNEKAFTIDDSANIWYLPQRLVKQEVYDPCRLENGTCSNKPQIYQEKGAVESDASNGVSYGSMNIRYALSDNAMLMIYGKRSAWQPVVGVTSVAGVNAATASGYADVKDPTNHQFGIGFGMKAGESLRIGAHASLGGVSASTAKIRSNSLFQLNAGLGFDISEAHNLDFALDLRLGSFTMQGDQGDLYQPNGMLRFGLLFKGEFQVHDVAKIVPYLNFSYDGRNVIHASDQVGNGAKQGSSALTMLQLGADLAIRPQGFFRSQKDILIQPGLGLAFASSTVSGNAAAVPPGGPLTIVTSDASSNRIIPYYGFSAEGKAFDWMTLRLGARQQIVSTNIGNTAANGAPSNETHGSTVLNTVTTGMGFRLQDWELDVNVNPQFFQNGLYAVNGVPTPFGIDWALRYRWN